MTGVDSAASSWLGRDSLGLAVVPEVGLVLLGLAASLFKEGRARLDLHSRLSSRRRRFAYLVGLG